MFHHRFGSVLLCGLTSTVLRPGLGALGFFRGFGDGFESLCGFSGAIRLDMRLNPFAAHLDRLVRCGIPNGDVGSEAKDYNFLFSSDNHLKLIVILIIE
jgi:hypothetical protein